MAHISTFKETMEAQPETISQTREHVMDKLVPEINKWNHYSAQIMQSHRVLKKNVPSQRKFVDIFNKYDKLMEKTDVGETTPVIVVAINEEKENVAEKFNQFQKKFKRQAELLRTTLDRIYFHQGDLKITLTDIQLSQNQDELLNMCIPILTGINVPAVDAKTKAIIEEWKELQLVSRFAYLYDQLRLVSRPDQVLHIDVHCDKD